MHPCTIPLGGDTWRVEPGFFWTLPNTLFPFANFNLYAFAVRNHNCEFFWVLWVLPVNYCTWVWSWDPQHNVWDERSLEVKIIFVFSYTDVFPQKYFFINTTNVYWISAMCRCCNPGREYTSQWNKDLCPHGAWVLVVARRETINIINKMIHIVVNRKSGAGTGIWGAGLGVGLVEKVRCSLMGMRELAMWLTASKVLWRAFPDPQVLGSTSHSLISTITT